MWASKTLGTVTMSGLAWVMRVLDTVSFVLLLMFCLHVEILRLLLLRIVDKTIRYLLLDAVSGGDNGRLSRHSTTIRHTRSSLSL